MNKYSINKIQMKHFTNFTLYSKRQTRDFKRYKKIPVIYTSNIYQCFSVLHING